MSGVVHPNYFQHFQAALSNRGREQLLNPSDYPFGYQQSLQNPLEQHSYPKTILDNLPLHLVQSGQQFAPMEWDNNANGPNAGPSRHVGQEHLLPPDHPLNTASVPKVIKGFQTPPSSFSASNSAVTQYHKNQALPVGEQLTLCNASY
jgi:hypothetical protein